MDDTVQRCRRHALEARHKAMLASTERRKAEHLKAAQRWEELAREMEEFRDKSSDKSSDKT